MSQIQFAKRTPLLFLTIRTTVQNLPRRQCRLLSSKNHQMAAPPVQENSTPQHKYTRKQQRPPPLADNVTHIINGTKGKAHPRYLAYEIEHLMKECSKLSSKKGNRNTVQLMHRLLEEKEHANQAVLEEMKKIDTSSIVPVPVPYIVNDSFFHLAMFAQTRGKDGPREVQNLIQLMTDEYWCDQKMQQQLAQCNLPSTEGEGWIDKRKRRRSCRPSTTTYNILLTALVEASENKPRYASQAETVLDEMRTLQKHKNWHTKPNTKSFELVIGAYARNNTFDAGTNAMRVFGKMMEAHEKALQEYRNHSISGEDYDFKEPSRNYRQIVVPTKKAVFSVVDAFLNSNTDRAPKLAESFILSLVSSSDEDDVEKVNNKNVIIDEHIFNRIIKGWTRRMNKTKNPKGRFEAASNAERLMRRMETLTFPQFAQTVETYNLCLNAWAQSDVKESAERALLIFDEITNHGTISLDLSSCHCLMTAFSRSFPHDINSAQEAETVLDRMPLLNTLGQQNEIIKPTQFTFSIAINAWAKSKNIYDANEIHKAAHARRLLDVLLKEHLDGNIDKPSIHAFTSVLNACTFPGKHDEKNIAEIAIRTYEDVMSDEHWLNIPPDHFFFANMIKAINAQMQLKSSPARIALFERIHKDAKEAGCATPRFMTEMREACSED